jgi:hypothetical protein
MAETNAELGRAVAEVLETMGATPETAGAALGINARTLAAMLDGIVPMRSLVIRFAQGVARNCCGRNGFPDWWGDVDAWLAKAGYAPRRDFPPGAPPPAQAVGTKPFRPPAPPATPAEPAGPEEMPARDFYRPSYERRMVGATCVHIFHVLDQEGKPAFEIPVPANVDYKARAALLKQDLAGMTRVAFDRKYGRYRLTGPQRPPQE